MERAIFKTGKGTILAPAVRDTWWQSVLERLREEPIVCVDLEASGLDWRHNHIVGYVFTFSGDPNDSFYLPVRHAAGGNILNYKGPQTATGWDGKSLHPIEPAIIKMLDQPGKLVFGHHLAFDLKFLWRIGMQKLDAWFECTMVNEALLDEHRYSYSLKSLCIDHDVQHKKDTELYEHLRTKFPDSKPGKEMGDYWKLHGEDPIACEYAEGDGTSTWQLRDWQYVKLGEEGLGRVHDVECRLIPVLTRMMGKGIRVNEERVRKIVDDVDSGRLEHELGFPEGFNCKAPTQVEEWLRGQGISHFGQTRSGKTSLTEAWLSTFDEGKKIVTLRKSRTLRDSFMKPLLDRHIWNGRVHANYHQMPEDDYGVVTGRLSCSDPNQQQASKRDPKIGRMHRSCFIPDEGMKWGSADYSQCEPVLLAVYSQARVLVEGFMANPPVDAHSSVTKAVNRQWAGMPQDEFDAAEIAKTPEFKAAREIGKRVNQTLITGGGQGVLTERYGILASDVKQIWADYFRSLPEIRTLQKASSAKMRRQHFVRSLLGRKARMSARDLANNRFYIATNRLLQCGNADVIKLKMVEVDDYLKSEGRPIDLLNNVHDSLDFQFHPELRHHFIECLNVMTNFGDGQAIELNVPLRVDFDEGDDWAEATFGAQK